MEDHFEESVKKAFLKVKHHNLALEKEIKLLKEFISLQNKKIEELLEKLSKFAENNPQKVSKDHNSPKSTEIKASSTGNQGVYSNIHSFTIHSFGIHSPFNYSFNYAQKEAEKPNPGLNKPSKDPVLRSREPLLPIKNRAVTEFQSSNISLLKENINNIFQKLSKQEFLTFLTIYQLEDELGHVTYSDVSNKLGLTEGCIRTYISSLIRKGTPLKKTRYNNKYVILSIHPDFRSLNLKSKLYNLYYRMDPTQSSLI